MEKQQKISLKVSVRIKPCAQGDIVATKEVGNNHVLVEDKKYGKYTSVIASSDDQEITF